MNPHARSPFKFSKSHTYAVVVFKLRTLHNNPGIGTSEHEHKTKDFASPIRPVSLTKESAELPLQLCYDNIIRSGS